MIHWLVQPAAALPATLPPGVLGETEAAQYAVLTVPKRRSDWLLGRWTAKELVQAHLEKTSGSAPLLETITIAADPDGAPYVSLDGARLPPSLSISHSHGTAFCALCAEPGAAVGADIEFVEPRAPEFVRDFFTTQEMAAVEALAPTERDEAVTLLWSAKEAVLKALREGLRVDTRQVEITLQGALSGAEWAPLAVTLHPELAVRFPGTWTAWARRHGDFVLSMALRIQPQAGALP